jgi:hypothetical protein
MGACDTKEEDWQNTPSTYCRCDEHDAGKRNEHHADEVDVSNTGGCAGT